jgi:hypothetical protein
MGEFLEVLPLKTGLDMDQVVTNILTQTMIKLGYFLLIIKQNSKLNLEDLVLLLMGIGLIGYCLHSEAHGIYALMKIVTNIIVVIHYLVTLMNYHLV